MTNIFLPKLCSLDSSIRTESSKQKKEQPVGTEEGKLLQLTNFSPRNSKEREREAKDFQSFTDQNDRTYKRPDRRNTTPIPQPKREEKRDGTEAAPFQPQHTHQIH
ncbi:hypothetical protein AAHA92_06148 [Salvia divinorum]|uniref:Uncharacterized protein n=1 Tax=Salvia divinorum TaxID=28513 RepID=A0ABD1I5T1_SALDI